MPYTRLSPDGQPVVFRSATDGAAAQTPLGPLKWFSSPRARVVLPLTARDPGCDIQARIQHAPTAAGPWANVGATPQVDDTTDDVALLSGTAFLRSVATGLTGVFLGLHLGRLGMGIGGAFGPTEPRCHAERGEHHVECSPHDGHTTGDR